MTTIDRAYSIAVTTGTTCPFEVGMWVEFSDNRRWWVKVWHWLIRRKIERHFRVVEVTSTSAAVIEETK